MTQPSSSGICRSPRAGVSSASALMPKLASCLVAPHDRADRRELAAYFDGSSMSSRRRLRALDAFQNVVWDALPIPPGHTPSTRARVACGRRPCPAPPPIGSPSSSLPSRDRRRWCACGYGGGLAKRCCSTTNGAHGAARRTERPRARYRTRLSWPCEEPGGFRDSPVSPRPIPSAPVSPRRSCRASPRSRLCSGVAPAIPLSSRVERLISGLHLIEDIGLSRAHAEQDVHSGAHSSNDS